MPGMPRSFVAALLGAMPAGCVQPPSVDGGDASVDRSPPSTDLVATDAPPADTSRPEVGIDVVVMEEGPRADGQPVTDAAPDAALDAAHDATPMDMPDAAADGTTMDVVRDIGADLPTHSAPEAALDPPRTIAPLSMGRVTSQRPCSAGRLAPGPTARRWRFAATGRAAPRSFASRRPGPRRPPLRPSDRAPGGGDALVDAVADALRSVTPDDLYGWLRHAGFRPKLE